MQSVLAKHQITQVTQPHYSPDQVPWDFWIFPKLKLPLKRKRFQTVDEFQESTTGKLMAIGRTMWGPKVPTLKGTEASLSYVQCFFFLVSSSVKVSICHSMWLDTFWKDYIHVALQWIGWYLSHWGELSCLTDTPTYDGPLLTSFSSVNWHIKLTIATSQHLLLKSYHIFCCSQCQLLLEFTKSNFDHRCASYDVCLVGTNPSELCMVGH